MEIFNECSHKISEKVRSIDLAAKGDKWVESGE